MGYEEDRSTIKGQGGRDQDGCNVYVIFLLVQILDANQRVDNTNSKHLKLYSIMAEHDNAGFPLSYCLLSTASAIDQGKRLEALAAWGRCLQDQYCVKPVFMHVDKDVAKNGCSKKV